MYQQINIILPEQTAFLIEQMTDYGDKSSFIENAVKYYIEHIEKDSIREQLKRGAIQRVQKETKPAFLGSFAGIGKTVGDITEPFEDEWDLD